MKISAKYTINKEVFVDLQEILKEYDIVESIEVKENDPVNKIILGNLADKYCRFCNKSYPQTSFKNVSHTIPEFLGNKSLLSAFECDNCNKYFAIFDNELARFTLPFNTFSGTKNKKNKTPKFKNGLEIYEDESNKINIINVPNEAIIDKQNIMFDLEPLTYIPDYIYRSIIKIGLSLIANDKIQNYLEQIEWLMCINNNTIVEQSMILSIFPFNSPIDKIRCVLFGRKQFVSRNIPKTIMILSYKNFSIQTFFPLDSSDNFESIFPYPHILSSTLDLQESLKSEKRMCLIPLQGKRKQRGEKIRFQIVSL